jgi:hypothetical protein
MKFWIGFVLGATAGGLVMSSLDLDQRRRLTRRSRSVLDAVNSGRSGRIATSVSDGVGDIADVATDRVTAVVESATTLVAESIEADRAPAD